ncbi:D-methionine transport system ATP-binding protein [Desulfitispora alkaliphila]
MIKLEQVSKVYTAKKNTVQALNQVNLSIDKGTIYGIMGLSGAGKSTLIRCINLLEKPNSGRVLIDNCDLTKLDDKALREARKKIGMIFQHFNLLSSRTVYENVAFPLEIAGLSKEEIKTSVDELLSLVGLSEKSSSYPSELSGGQKQRVGIARALANEPKVLLCDEATSALDPETTQSILSLLKDINKKFGLTIVIITHEMHVIKDICDRVAIIDNGHIVEEAAVLKVFTEPQTEVAKKFVKTFYHYCGLDFKEGS